MLRDPSGAAKNSMKPRKKKVEAKVVLPRRTNKDGATTVEYHTKVVSSKPDAFWSSSAKLNATMTSRNAASKPQHKWHKTPKVPPKKRQQVLDFENGQLLGFYQPDFTPPPPGGALPPKPVKTVLDPGECEDQTTACRAVGKILLDQCAETVNKIWNEDPHFATLFGETKTKRAIYHALSESLYYAWADARNLHKEAKVEYERRCAKKEPSPAFVFY